MMTTHEEAKKAWDDLMRSPWAKEMVERLFHGYEVRAYRPPRLTMIQAMAAEANDPVEIISFRMERGEVVSQDDRRRAYRVVTTEGHMVALHVMSRKCIKAGASREQ